MHTKRARALALDAPAPQTLKKYTLLGQIAKGGMADVFLARADGLGGFERLLVIKRILPELARDTEFVRMFLDEARIAATLHHSHIVQVYDVDMAEGYVFYAMEHLHGKDTATMLERSSKRAQRIPIGNAIAIVTAVAAGLHYAHEQWGSDGRPLDIVHRDVAPNNVIVTYDGNVKLIDFGIARAANNLSRTRFGLFKGKLPYASPEQARCEPVDRRTDVFSLGVLLYELTTGQPLFEADTDYELLRLVSEAMVVRPRLRDKAYPRELEAIVLKALARDRDDRYPTTQALQRDLEVFARQRQLDLTAMSLARLMERLFAEELQQWQRAQHAGLTLEQHIITVTTTPRAVREPTSVDVDASGEITDATPLASGPVAAMFEPASEPVTARGATPVAVPSSEPAIARGAEPPTRRDAGVARRRRSRIAKGVVAVAAAAGLIGLGAVGATWWLSRSPVAFPAMSNASTEASANSELATAAHAPVDQLAVPGPGMTDKPAGSAADWVDKPAVLTTTATDKPAAPALDAVPRPDPLAPATLDAAIELEPRPTSKRKPRPAMMHGAAVSHASAPGGVGTPAAPDRSPPALDDDTLDNVVPRSTRSP
jgi:serine/threonine protein kinase